MRRWVLWITLLCCPSFASADGALDTKGHREQKQAAYAAFELGKYSEAITRFEQAYRLKRDPRLLYDIALAYYRRYELYHRNADLHQARHLFRRFLLLVPLPAAGADRRRVQQARSYSNTYLKRIEQVLAAQGADRERRANPEVGTASQPAARDQRRRASTSTQPVSGPGATARAPQAAPLSHLDTPRSASRPAITHWLLYGLAATLGAVACLTGGLALAADHRSDDLAASADLSAAQQANRSEKLALATDVLIGAALLSAAVAVVFHVRHWRNRRTELAVGTALGLRTTF